MNSSSTGGERVWKRCIWNLHNPTDCYITERRQTLRSTDLLYLRNLIRQHVEALLLLLLRLLVCLEVHLEQEGRPGCQAANTQRFIARQNQRNEAVVPHPP